jgi:hypothetical protein
MFEGRFALWPLGTNTIKKPVVALSRTYLRGSAWG